MENIPFYHICDIAEGSREIHVIAFLAVHVRVKGMRPSEVDTNSVLELLTKTSAGVRSISGAISAHPS